MPKKARKREHSHAQRPQLAAYYCECPPLLALDRRFGEEPASASLKLRRNCYTFAAQTASFSVARNSALLFVRLSRSRISSVGSVEFCEFCPTSAVMRRSSTTRW